MDGPGLGVSDLRRPSVGVDGAALMGGSVATLAADGLPSVDAPGAVTHVSLPPGASAEWREVVWTNPVARDLTGATLAVDPPTAFRQLRVCRADGTLLANQSWDQSRTRGIRVWPEDTRVAAGERLRIQAVAWWPTPVALTACLAWQGGD